MYMYLLQHDTLLTSTRWYFTQPNDVKLVSSNNKFVLQMPATSALPCGNDQASADVSFFTDVHVPAT